MAGRWGEPDKVPSVLPGKDSSSTGYYYSNPVRAGLSDGRLVPPPSHIFSTLVDLARTGELWRHMAATLLRVAAGFALGVAAGTVLGALTGYSALARRLLDCLLMFPQEPGVGSVAR